MSVSQRTHKLGRSHPTHTCAALPGPPDDICDAGGNERLATMLLFSNGAVEDPPSRREEVVKNEEGWLLAKQRFVDVLIHI